MKITEEFPRCREKMSDLNKGQQPSMPVLGITHQDTDYYGVKQAWIPTSVSLLTSSAPQFLIHKMKVMVSTASGFHEGYIR